MGKEIERKYLVDSARLGPLMNGIEITQGYISARKNAVVRVRQTADKAWLTLKGPNDGAVRSEFEYEIPPADARQMIEEFCEWPGDRQNALPARLRGLCMGD